MKEFFLTAYHKNDKKRPRRTPASYTGGNNHNYQVGSVKWIQQEPQQQWAILAGTVINNSAVQIADSEFYIELDLHNDLFDQPIDTLKRIHDYELPPVAALCVTHRIRNTRRLYPLSIAPKELQSMRHKAHSTVPTTSKGRKSSSGK